MILAALLLLAVPAEHAKAPSRPSSAQKASRTPTPPAKRTPSRTTRPTAKATKTPRKPGPHPPPSLPGQGHTSYSVQRQQQMMREQQQQQQTQQNIEKQQRDAQRGVISNIRQ
jgi:hypothetical protein